MGGKKRQRQPNKLDAKEKNFLKTYGEIHPINDACVGKAPKKIQIVEDRDESSESEESQDDNLKYTLDEESLEQDELVLPYQLLLNQLNETSETRESAKDTKKSKKQKKKEKKAEELANSSNAPNNDDDEDDEIVIEAASMYSKEVFCKDAVESDDTLKQDEFHKHIEIELSDKSVNLLNENSVHETENLNLPVLGNVSYTSRLSDHHHNLNQLKKLDNFTVKQRLRDRMSNSLEQNLDEVELSDRQIELLNVILNYIDLYAPNVDYKSDLEVKFVYVLHALNHVLKTRSRIIAHNDKIKQNKNEETEHLDQGLTRPKVLILVPFRKQACQIIKILMALLMRKDEEYITNKKRFFEEFSDAGYTNDEDKDDKQPGKGEDYEAVFNGNIDDHFRFGLSVSKKTLKLYTEFYSSDIIIASPVGLRTVIGDEGDKNRDVDFLSSIELLIVDNADILLMQNWDHVQAVFNNLHLQPKKSHDVDFSRVRPWVLNGQSKYYRQTLIFSSIPEPQINSLFNKFCFNYEGKVQVKVINKIGTICQIGFQLSQVFHRIHCDSPADLPKARFDFFIDKILPQFKDEMMSHTLIFIPSYFDFVQLRNYFKKNDLSGAYVSEYSDRKTIDRSRLLFYDGRIHYMLLSERFHFYKRYRIRGINHLIFYDLPSYPSFYSQFCNYLPDQKRIKQKANQTFSSTVLYSKYDAQKLSAIVGHQRAAHMINSDKSVHMFMVDET